MAATLDVSRKVARLRDYVPIRFSLSGGEPVVQWCYLGDASLTQPFFDQTIDSLFYDPFYLLFQTRTQIEVLAEFAEAYGGPKPSGFIFHMSRCGSTLITQMLATQRQNVVLSEPSPVDHVLRVRRRYPQVTAEQQFDWVRWMIRALGHRRHPDQRHHFIKFDCWHTLLLPLLCRAFPGVPCIFLYRDPVEVLVSQINRRGAQMIPSLVETDLFGIPAAAAATIAETEYCARVLAAICQAALDHGREHPLLLVNYRQLPGIVWEELLAYFKLAPTHAEIEDMRRAARFDAKQPGCEFTADSAEKRRAATPEILRECELRLDPLFAQLESARTGLAKPTEPG